MTLSTSGIDKARNPPNPGLRTRAHAQPEFPLSHGLVADYQVSQALKVVREHERRSGMPGMSTSAVEVTNISPHGFWLLVDDRELFLPLTCSLGSKPLRCWRLRMWRGPSRTTCIGRSWTSISWSIRSNSLTVIHDARNRMCNPTLIRRAVFMNDRWAAQLAAKNRPIARFARFVAG